MALKIAIAGGGTGGHIYPGLAVAAALREAVPGVLIEWIGNEEGMDRSIVEGAGISFRGIPAGKFRRDLSLKNLRDSLRVISGFAASRAVLKEMRPDVLFSKGGYVSVPPCAAARSLGIPVLTHESDVSPGLATRLNARFADRVLVSYEETLAYLSASARKRAVVTGNPVRDAVLKGNAARGRTFMSFSGEKPIALVLGGSQGARELNALVASALGRLSGSWDVVHQTGPANDAPAARSPSYLPLPYIRDELPDILAAADAVIARSGAATIWECASLGKPMVLLPLRSAASRGDQMLNAELFAKRGAAFVLPPGDAALDPLLSAMAILKDDPSRKAAMRDAARSVAGAPAAPTIAKLIIERAGGIA